MRVILLLRSTVAGPRRRPVGVLAILTVIIGVVTMHSMSGSPTMHSHAVPHEASPVATEQVIARSTTTAEVLTASAAVLPAAQTPAGHSADEQRAGDCLGCCENGLATAMCLMILVAFLALILPARRLLWRLPLKPATFLRPALVGACALAAPSLYELCISRT